MASLQYDNGAGPRRLRGLVVAGLAILLAGCAQSSLLEGLDERQANEVVAVMLRNNITATKAPHGKKGYQVQVSSADMAEAVELVQREDLPSARRRQIADEFPADAMVSTPLSERARLLSAIEQRLEESLSTLSGVHSARVHVSYDAKSNGGRAQEAADMHIAAVLLHDSGANQQNLVQAAKRFLRNTFVQVSYENVSVVLSEMPAPKLINATPAPSPLATWLPWAIAALLGSMIVFILIVGKLSSGSARVWKGLRRRIRRQSSSRGIVHAR